jgi:hypothetical protein
MSKDVMKKIIAICPFTCSLFGCKEEAKTTNGIVITLMN